MEVYDRKNRVVIDEKEYQQKTLEFLYHTKIGRVLLKSFIARPCFSNMRACYQRSRFSKKDIVPFIDKYDIDMSAFDGCKFNCFNEFFTRCKEVEIKAFRNELISPADSKLSVFDISDDLVINVKNSKYTVGEIIGDNWLAKQYKGGKCLVFRLSVTDYHRYINVDSGMLLSVDRINGMLHTIRPISEEFRVYSRNTREVSVLDTTNFGKIIQVEVGALLVGRIKNNKREFFIKGDEKGYFEFGGSTIIILLKDNVEIDSDIIEQCKLGREVKVSIGEVIGVRKD